MSLVRDSLSFVAAGTIPTSAFLAAVAATGDPTQDGLVRAAVVGDKPIGISPRFPNGPAISLPPGNNAPAPPPAAFAGQSIAGYLPGDVAQLTAGAGGWNEYAFLKPDANSCGVPATATGDKYGAQALETVPAGAIGRVLIVFGTI